MSIIVGSIWREKDARRPYIDVPSRSVRVMGLVEGYVVARFKGAAPFLELASQWHDRFEPAPKKEPRP